MIQFDLFTTYKSGPTVTDSGTAKMIHGMKRAKDHADKVHDGWSAQAYSFMVDFIRVNGQPFMTEDVREASRNIVPPPPNLRAWGSIVRRAAIAGLIYSIGYGKVKNDKAHNANAAIWKRKYFYKQILINQKQHESGR